MSIKRVFEYSWLQYENGLRGYQSWFKEEHYDALVDFHDNKGGDKYFELVRSGVRFLQYVGVIQVQDLTLEILPKTDRSSDAQFWHDVLWDMLRQTRFLDLEYISEASLRYKRHSILHLYFHEYILQVNQLLKNGLIKSYSRKEENLNKLKGSILFSRHLTKNVVHKERFFSRYEVYDYQNQLNCILYEALLILKSITQGQSISDEVNRTLTQYPEVSRIKVVESTFNNLQFSRKTFSYKKATQIARMIILNYSPDIKGGKNDLLALLFDMNELWEEFIYRQLQKAGVKVEFQLSKDFWERRTIRPDLLVHANGQKIILDTKWKSLNNAEPSIEDLRQVFAYNIYWDADKGFLVYPKMSFSPKTKPGKYHKGHTNDLKKTCQVLYVDIVDRNGINNNIASDILKQIEA